MDDQLQVIQPAPEARFYTVNRGDTLSKIAQVHYGDTTQYPRIFEAKRPLLRDPDDIYPGQTLRIPNHWKLDVAESSLREERVARLADGLAGMIHWDPLTPRGVRALLRRATIAQHPIAGYARDSVRAGDLMFRGRALEA